MKLLNWLSPKYEDKWIFVGRWHNYGLAGEFYTHYKIKLKYSHKLRKWKLSTSGSWPLGSEHYYYALSLFTYLKSKKATPEFLKGINCKYGVFIND